MNKTRNSDLWNGAVIENTVSELHGESVEFITSHPDVDGKWNGYETWIVKYEVDGSDKLLAYILAGNYYEIGKYKHNKLPRHTRFETITLLTRNLRDGYSSDILYFFVRLGLFACSIFSKGGQKCER